MELKASLGKVNYEGREDKLKREEDRAEMTRKIRDSQGRLDKLKEEVEELRKEKRKHADRCQELELENKGRIVVSDHPLYLNRSISR